jgi:acyl transferase domain-containing protein
VKVKPHTNEPIAIVGMGCRFPGAPDLEAFWNLLRNGWDAITHADPKRALAPAELGGFIDDVAAFDARFFGISSRDAIAMDPQQRILLEVAWEGLQDAGVVIEKLSGTNTGVFIGVSSQDYGVIQSNPENSPWVVANRLSHCLGFRGPSIAVDTAGSSSLIAVHLACQSLRNGESSIAVAGGVNVILSSARTASLSQRGLIAPDGRCRSFDSRANGAARGEGVGVVVLKTLSQAQLDGDRIYALIPGSATNHDGNKNKMFAPSREAQETLLRAAYHNAAVSSAEVDYVEANSAGAFLGDLIEANALGKVLSVDRDPGRPCLIGSVKTNIGHLEAAAGVASLIKVALALHHEELPPSLNCSEPNKDIAFDKLKLQVTQQLTHLARSDRASIAGISAFGLGGANAHVVLEQAPDLQQQTDADKTSWRLLPLSAKNAAALLLNAEAYRNFLKTNENICLRDVCYTASARRDHFDCRLAVIGRSSSEMVQQLDRFIEKGTPDDGESPLESTRNVYESGGKVDWSKLFPEGGCHVSLPLPPWQRESFWFEVKDKIVDVDVNGRLLGHRIHSPLKEVLFETNLAASSFPFLSEHRPFGITIAPVTVYLLMALAAAKEISPDKSHAITDISVSRALIIEEGKNQKTQLILTTADSGEITFHLYSESESQAKESAWTLNGSGRLSSATVASTSPVLLEQARAQCTRELPGADLYSIFSAQGLEFGDAFQWVDRIWAGEKVAVGRLRTSRPAETHGTEIIHPGLLDSCYHVLAACHPSTWDKTQPDSDRLFVPVSIAEFNFYGYVDEQLWCHASLPNDQPAGDEEYVGNLSLLRASGEPVAEIKGIKFRLVEREAFLRAKPALLRKPWRAQPGQMLRTDDDAELTSVEILAAEPSQRLALIERYVRQQVARVTKFPASTLNVHEPLINIGIDSLMSMEMITKLQQDLGITIPVAKLVGGISIDQLVHELMRHFTEKSLIDIVRSPAGAESTEAYEVL